MAEDNAGGPDPPKPGLTPSNSTNMTILGGSIAALIMAILNQFGINFPAGVESAIATLAAAALGYLPASGRK